MSGLVVGIDQDGVAHRIRGTAYVVRKGCPVHDPRSPWWLMPCLLLSCVGTSTAVTLTLDTMWPWPAASLTGFAAGVTVMLLGAWRYDTQQRRRR